MFIDMKIRFLCLALLVHSCQTCFAINSNEAGFWQWFERNEERLFKFEESPNVDLLFDELTGQMTKVHPDLTFEFGPVIGGKREFVISAAGSVTAFPAVEKLFSIAPRLSRWNWVKFRPRRPAMDISFGERTINSSDVRVIIIDESEPNHLGLMMVMKGYSLKEDELYGQASYLMLDQALGEYDVEMKVGGIELTGTLPTSLVVSYSLDDLPAASDTMLERKLRDQ